MTVLFTNNATSRLASALTSGATTMTVTTGEGAKYPSPATSVEWFPVTLIKDTGALEIVRCTSRSGDVLTIRRAEEGTTALAFAAGDRVELRMTAAALIEFQQGGQLFMPFWWPNRAAIPAGFVAADGQTLPRATYPDAAAGIIAGNVPTVADATWLSTPLQRGRYTVGDGSTTFRLPDYNGKYSGSLGAVFMRGDGALSAGTNGDIQLDDFKSHAHALNTVINTGGGGSFWNGGSYGLANSGPTLTTGGTETRPLNVTGCWVVKLFGAITNPGSANAAQLATDLANLVAVAYTRTNAVGTVTQSGGTPTGAIIETGTNSNGRFTKWADGTMICEFSSSTPSATNQSIGAIFASLTTALTFPVPFVGVVPTVSPALNDVTVASCWAGIGGAITLTTVPLTIFSFVNSAGAKPGYIAKGRWF